MKIQEAMDQKSPVVAPVTEEIEDSYAQWQRICYKVVETLKQQQALSAQLQEKWADEREWQQKLCLQIVVDLQTYLE